MTGPEEFGILGREVHVWALSTHVSDTRVHLLETRLSDDERLRAERFRHRDARAGFVVTRYALRWLLGRYMGGSAEDLALRYTSMGKPFLAMAHADIRFSVAHSRGVALLAFGAIDVGIDVERIRPVAREARIAARVFDERTRALLASLPAAERRSAFFAAWTQREALVKAVGGALLATRDPLDFRWPAAIAPRRLECPGSSGATEIWTVASLPESDGYAAALVAAGEIDVVRTWRLDLP
jgi:4'-phosphopantetheinyl transferase